MNRKTSTLMSLGISIALIAATIWFLYNHHSTFGYGNGRWMMPHHMTTGGGGMGIIMIIFWVALIAAIALVVSGVISGKNSSASPGNRQHTDTMEILKHRYAKGEIDKTQYESMKRELQ
ncbi:MAG: SHOCT domain-containing protein [Desulfosarcina sp.]